MVLLLGHSEARGKAGDLLSNLYGQACLARLEDYWLLGVELGAEKDRVLDLDKRAELAVEILKHIVAAVVPLNRRVAPTHTYVVGDAHIGLLPAPNADVLLVLSVNDIEDLLRDSGGGDRLEHDVVLLRLFYVYDVDQAIVMRDLERENLLA